MQTQEENELIRQIVQACAVCKHGRGRMICHRSIGQCHNRRVREWRKRLETILKEKEALCIAGKTDS